MTLDLQVVFNDIQDRIEISDNSSYTNSDAVGVLSLTNPLGGVVLAPTDIDVNPQIAFPATTSLNVQPIPRFTDTNNILTGEYTLTYDYRYSDLVTLPIVDIKGGTGGLGYFEVDGDFPAALLVSTNLLITATLNNTPFTITSSELRPNGRTRLYVSGVVVLESANGNATFAALITESLVKKFTINSVSLAAPCITSVISCFSGKMTVNDATPNVDGVNLVSRAFLISPPIGAIDPETGLQLEATSSTSQSVEITKLFSERWVADITRVQSVVMAPGVSVLYTSSTVQNIDVACELDFCEVAECIAKTEATIEASKSYDIVKAKLLTEKMNKASRLINIIQTFERCGKEDKIPDVVKSLKEILSATGCDCGCGSSSDKPVYIPGLGGLGSAVVASDVVGQFYIRAENPFITFYRMAADKEVLIQSIEYNSIFNTVDITLNVPWVESNRILYDISVQKVTISGSASGDHMVVAPSNDVIRIQSLDNAVLGVDGDWIITLRPLLTGEDIV